MRLADVEGCLTLMAAFFLLDKERTMTTTVIPERGCLKRGMGGRDCNLTDPREGLREDEGCSWYAHGNLGHVVDD